jgi:glycine/D-amino acid oxidase-like deaminating enzyme
MPAQSNVLVTRPLTDAELLAQGWTSEQMCYDTRNLLHYFRLMPDRRFLFGMRGGLFSGQRAEAKAHKALHKDFKRLFPEWADIEIQAMWSGLVALAKSKMPFVGPFEAQDRVYVSACYHGNGVAMGSYCGHLAARMVLGDDHRPEVLRQPLRRFPLGSARRALMPPLYIALELQDRLARRV